MDRLTDKRFVGEGFYQPKSREERLEIFANIPPLIEIYSRLAEYEDTGLTPEQVKDMKAHCENTVELKDGMKKLRSGNFVIYDIDYLLENLAREICMLYQAKSDFDKPVFDLSKIRKMFADYKPCKECTNPDTYGEICVKCGACGRKFDDEGNLILV